MTNREIKESFINFLDSRGVYYKPVHDNWHRTRCPLCGDTQKNMREGHFYMCIDLENDYSMGYNCFRCGETGIINEEILESMDAPQELKQNISILNSHSKKVNKKQKISEEKLLYFDFKQPPVKRGKKIDYLENRLGIELSEMDFRNYKIITSLYDFISVNDIRKYPFNEYQMRALDDHYVGFLSNGNSHILFRDITEKEHIAWVKYPITKDSMENKTFYSVASSTDIFTADDITINLCEGVLDIMGVTKHIDTRNENVMNIAITGKTYDIMIYRLIQLGLVGSNITINIYSDNDKMYGNKRNAYRTSMDFYKKILSKYKPLYKKINVFYNMKAKDFGYPKDRIVTQKYIL